jgi:hypothetical protein
MPVTVSVTTGPDNCLGNGPPAIARMTAPHWSAPAIWNLITVPGLIP